VGRGGRKGWELIPEKMLFINNDYWVEKIFALGNNPSGLHHQGIN